VKKLKLTQATDYAFRAVLHLATRRGEVVEAQEIAEVEKVPKRFLLKICRKLSKAGIIKSYRGKNGGYQLVKSPEEITLKDVIEVVEGDLVVNKCQEDPDACNKGATEYCSVHQCLNSIRDVLAKEFAKYNFKRLIELEEE